MFLKKERKVRRKYHIFIPATYSSLGVDNRNSQLRKMKICDE